MQIRRGFTLIELLVVIAIIAVLAVTIVLTLNPADLLRQARDTTRSSDLTTLNKALALYQVDGNGSLGTSSVLYVSRPDSSTTCANLALPPAPVGFTYRCAPAATHRAINGTGWVPVNFSSLGTNNPLSQLPVDPTNTSTRYYTYATNGSGWQLGVGYESTKFVASPKAIGSATNIVPEEWITVPGNSLYGTNTFQVMKYEAKCVSSSTHTGLITPTSGSNTYANSTTPCTTANTRYVASTQGGYPITDISHNTAKSYCENIGAHLITNEEWMTIARNAEAQASNWSGGVIGSGYLYSGNNNTGPSTAFIAGPDSDPYYGTGYGGTSSQRRTLHLSNGSVIWDLSGNVWEHVMRGITDTQTAINPTPICSSGSSGYCGYTIGDDYEYITNYGSTPVATIGPSNSSWGSAHGVGVVETPGGGPGGSVFVRGGGWYDGAIAGAFTISLSYAPTSAYQELGFRCAK